MTKKSKSNQDYLDALDELGKNWNLNKQQKARLEELKKEARKG